MAGLVVSGVLKVGFVHDLLSLTAISDLVAGFLDVGHLDLLAITAARMKRAFVEEIGEISAGHAGGDTRDALKVHRWSQLEALGVHGQDGLAATQVG